MSRNYKFHNSEGLYFVSFAVVGWLDVFTRNEYKDLAFRKFRILSKKQRNGNSCLVHNDQSCSFNF
jgi:hypothetical protein